MSTLTVDMANDEATTKEASGLGTRAAEQLLRQRILAGEHDLFKELVGSEHQLRAYANRLLGNWADAEEVVQEATWKAFVRLDQFRGEASFRTWLCSIIHNETRMHRRSKRRESRFQPLDEALSLLPQERGTPISALDTLVRDQASSHLQRAAAQLPPRYQAVVRLRFLEDASIAETARRLALSLAATKSRQHRACEMLRQRLDRAEVTRDRLGR